MLGENPDESRATRGHLVAGLSKWAKYGVLAMVVADVVGVVLVQHRLSQPAPDAALLADDAPIAMADTASAPASDALSRDVLPRDVLPRDVVSGDSQRAGDTFARFDSRSLPAVSRIDVLPAPLPIEPLALEAPQASPKVARAMQAALRAPVIPTVRIPELRAVRKANRTFATAFTSDITSATQSSRQAPAAAYEAPSAAASVADPSATVDLPAGNATPAGAESTQTPVPAQVEAPVPEFGGSSPSQQLQLDLPAPAAPEARASSADEIPAR